MTNVAFAVHQERRKPAGAVRAEFNTGKGLPMASRDYSITLSILLHFGGNRERERERERGLFPMRHFATKRVTCT